MKATPTPIVGVEPSVATDIVVIGAPLRGNLAHRRVMKQVKIGEKYYPAKVIGKVELPAHTDDVFRYEQAAACLDTKGTPLSWGWAQANGAHLCPDCWEDGYGAEYDGAPAFQLEEPPLEDPADDTPPPAQPAAVAAAPAPPQTQPPTEPLWEPEWGPAEPPDDDYFPPGDWEAPTEPRDPWDYGGNYRGTRPVVKGPDLP